MSNHVWSFSLSNELFEKLRTFSSLDHWFSVTRLWDGWELPFWVHDIVAMVAYVPLKLPSFISETKMLLQSDDEDTSANVLAMPPPNVSWNNIALDGKYKSPRIPEPIPQPEMR